MIRVKNHHTPPTIRPDRDLERRQMEVEEGKRERKCGAKEMEWEG